MVMSSSVVVVRSCHIVWCIAGLNWAAGSLAGPYSESPMARDCGGAAVVLEALPPFTRRITVGRLTRFHHAPEADRTRFSGSVPNPTGLGRSREEIETAHEGEHHHPHDDPVDHPPEHRYEDDLKCRRAHR